MEEAINCLKGRLISHWEFLPDNELGSADELRSAGIRVDRTGEVKVALVYRVSYICSLITAVIKQLLFNNIKR